MLQRLLFMLVLGSVTTLRPTLPMAKLTQPESNNNSTGNDLHCLDWQGQLVPDGSQYMPNKDDPCTTCTCDGGFPIMCSSVMCSPPDCKHHEQIKGECCKFNCIIPPDHGQDRGINHTDLIFPGSNSPDADTTNLGLRLVASTVTSLLILALLLFMIHRLRQRRMLITMRRLNNERRSQEDNMPYMTEYDHVDVGVEFPPYEEPPPPYTPPKPPDVVNGEAPPPYESVPGTQNNNNEGESSGGGNTPLMPIGPGICLASVQMGYDMEPAETHNTADGVNNNLGTNIPQDDESRHTSCERLDNVCTRVVPNGAIPCQVATLLGSCLGEGNLSPEERNDNTQNRVSGLDGENYGLSVAVTSLSGNHGNSVNNNPSQVLVRMHNNNPQSSLLRDDNANDNTTPYVTDPKDLEMSLPYWPCSRPQFIKRSDSIEIRRGSSSPRNSFYFDDSQGSSSGNSSMNTSTSSNSPRLALDGVSNSRQPRGAILQYDENEGVLILRESNYPRSSGIQSQGTPSESGDSVHSDVQVRIMAEPQGKRPFQIRRTDLSPMENDISQSQDIYYGTSEDTDKRITRTPSRSPSGNCITVEPGRKQVSSDVETQIPKVRPSTLHQNFQQLDLDQPDSVELILGASKLNFSQSMDSNQEDTARTSFRPEAKVGTSGVGRSRPMSPSGSSSSPQSPPHVVPRSGSISSQISQFSVCSETGERKRPRALSLLPVGIRNDAPYPVSPLSCGPMGSPTDGLGQPNIASAVSDRAHHRSRNNAVSSTEGKMEAKSVKNSDCSFVTGQDQSPNIPRAAQSERNVESKYLRKGKKERSSAKRNSSCASKKTGENTSDKDAERSVLKKMKQRRRQSAGANLGTPPNNVTVNGTPEEVNGNDTTHNRNESPERKKRIKRGWDAKATYKQYGFIDNPEALTVRDNVSLVKGHRSKDSKREHSRERSRDRTSSKKGESPDRNRWHGVRDSGSYEHQSAITQGTNGDSGIVDVNSKTRSHQRDSRSPERRKKRRSTGESLVPDISISNISQSSGNLADSEGPPPLNIGRNRNQVRKRSRSRENRKYHESRHSMPAALVDMSAVDSYR